MTNSIINLTENKTVFGFWIYILSDCFLFGTLFATYAVLRGNTFGGPSGAELFDLSFVLVETLILLTSSFTAGLAMLAANKHYTTSKNKEVSPPYVQVVGLLGLTLLLGITFLGLELKEFTQFVAEGAGPQRSGFLSAFFTLVGTHGLHVAAGSVWLIVLMIQILRRGLTEPIMSRFMRWSLFWHFLDVVWIFIFTFVYLMGVMI
ncbi:cytochrome o ubiquinol oxidase subunit III [Candidatus Kaiserbacteria bacterium]|nr:cytochrome o ubiquinol oxidase subunit III [Candidatus Kaiserbacteria bacterium]